MIIQATKSRTTEHSIVIFDFRNFTKTPESQFSCLILHHFEKYIWEHASQARKALQALRGIVKLQAIIRGRNVRRQAMNTLKCLQSIVNIQSQVCAKRIQMVEGSCSCDENKSFHKFSDKIIRVSIKYWRPSLLS